jgi:hypothetical protein
MKLSFKISLLFIIISITACDLFTTRDAETPDQGRSNFQPAVQPAIVISNLKNSLIDKNVQNYIACFSDPVFTDKLYTFSASGEAASIYPIFLQGWGVSEEQRYITSVFSKTPKDFPISLSLTEENFTNLSGDSLIYTATYFLNVPIPSGDQSFSNYSGNLQFNMVRDSRSEWVIYLWKDNKSQTLPSWSELKGNYY